MGEDESYKIRLMVPNSKLFFFFTEDFEAFVDPSYPKIALMKEEEIVSSSFFSSLQNSLPFPPVEPPLLIPFG